MLILLNKSHLWQNVKINTMVIKSMLKVIPVQLSPGRLIPVAASGSTQSHPKYSFYFPIKEKIYDQVQWLDETRTKVVHKNVS